MSTSLTDFLLDLAQDPQKAEAFKENPKEMMAEAGLSDEDQELLLSGDPQAIKEAIDTDKTAGEFVTVVFISVVFD
ncbi:MAG TPA: IniB N-terminal domain-containing protein [Candidatus Sulfomarinibacteraceae bacterium]|nr:IniB N-terminal domain-containing protein [Candidatus Sulfomarinibacteraceae bacterium]